MATTYKVLGQVNPTAATATTLYTVPAGTQAVISTISVCNLTAGEALAAKHYIAYDSKVSGNDTLFITIGATLGAGDVITVYEGAADLSFNAYGSEIA